MRSTKSQISGPLLTTSRGSSTGVPTSLGLFTRGLELSKDGSRRRWLSLGLGRLQFQWHMDVDGSLPESWPDYCTTGPRTPVRTGWTTEVTGTSGRPLDSCPGQMVDGGDDRGLVQWTYGLLVRWVLVVVTTERYGGLPRSFGTDDGGGAHDFLVIWTVGTGIVLEWCRRWLFVSGSMTPWVFVVTTTIVCFFRIPLMLRHEWLFIPVL